MSLALGEIIDLSLLVLFIIFISVFLYKRRKRVEKQGIMFIYRTQLGLKIMRDLGRKHKKLLKITAVVSIIVGYLLMISFTLLFSGGLMLNIAKSTGISTIDKAPPVALLIPYFTRIFGLQEFFPVELYWIYFIVIIAVVAIVHEGAHGVFMNFYNMNIKSSGFLFLGPILGFFVEEDEKEMKSKKIKEQLAILSAGVFANLITALICFGLLFLVFNYAYTPYGVEFNNYVYSDVPLGLISGAIVTDEVIQINGDIEATKIIVEDKSYFVESEFLEIDLSEYNPEIVVSLFQDQPAIRNNLQGTIIEINNERVTTVEELGEELDKYAPGEQIEIVTDLNGEILEYEIELGESYLEGYEDQGVVGIYPGPKDTFNFFRNIEPFKEYGVAYQAISNQEVTDFFYYLLIWIVLINIFVALFNMLPVGFLDGGRFFYLTIFKITKDEKFSAKALKYVSIFLLILFIGAILKWVYRIIVL